MTLIPPNLVRLRTKRASNFFRSYFPYENRVGKIYQALVTELSSDRKYYVAHNEFYEQILVPKEDYYMGQWWTRTFPVMIKVAIYNSHFNGL